MKRRNILFVLVPVALAGACLFAAAWKMAHPRENPPSDYAEFVSRTSDLGLHSSVCPSCLYLSVDDVPFDDLNHLTTSEEDSSRWKGVVCCSRIGPSHVMDWDGVRMGPWLIRGDRDITRKVVARITQSRRP